jgi:4-hydroxythreonine-4-phosphate dehydrogenase
MDSSSASYRPGPRRRPRPRTNGTTEDDDEDEDEDEIQRTDEVEERATMSRKPLIGITIGDHSGIGPEVVLRALKDARVREAARLVVIGDPGILERVNNTFHLRAPKLKPAGGHELPSAGDGPFLLTVCADFSGKCSKALALRGKPSAAAAKAAVDCIFDGIMEAEDSRLDAVVTAPINKHGLSLAHYWFTGHTEYIAEYFSVRKPVMMMVGGGLRVALVTTHAAIKDLPGLITRKNVLDTIRIVHRDLRRWFGLRKPHIGVCGLNPHAGEAGLFGIEEKKSIAPAIRQARREGIACDGPIPADAAFTPKLRARHDAFVAMFHDQACIPVKMLAFDSGVNVTLGLPIIRTSPDHGTAYDIVRQGKADPGSMVAAILLASQMARRITTKTPRHQERRL